MKSPTDHTYALPLLWCLLLDLYLTPARFSVEQNVVDETRDDCRVMTDLIFNSYEIAVLYLQQADYNLDTAIETYLADDLWEKENPLQSRSQGKRKLGAKR